MMIKRPKVYDEVSEWEKLANQAIKIAKYKQTKRRSKAIIDFYTEWQKISKNFIFGRVNGEEISNAYVRLDAFSKEYTMDACFADFVDALSSHTDRMFFNVWIHCQISLVNAMELASDNLVKED